MKKLLKMTINGEAVEVYVDPAKTIIDMLRDDLYLTGTKRGCGVGECGACTIILNGKTVNSCIVPVMKADGSEIITIEGVESKDGSLHPIQKQFIEKGSVQCGFCIPGMVLSTKSLLDKNLSPTKEEVRHAMGGNICRCTGYVKIEDAIYAAAEEMKSGGKK